MSDSFDPYHIWLGIPPKDQPPNHYRLLGLQDLEENTDVIDAAANRQTTYLHEMAAGPNRKESQQLLNEIATARRCLLNPEKKQEYDGKLKAEQEASHPPTAPVAVPVAQAVAPAAAPQPPAADDNVSEVPAFNFSPPTTSDAPADADAGFPTFDTSPASEAAPTVQATSAEPSATSESAPKVAGKKPIPKQWILTGCSILGVAIVAGVVSSGSGPDQESAVKPTSTRLSGNGSAETTSTASSSEETVEAQTGSNENAPDKKPEPSLFDQVSDSENIFKVPSNFGNQKKKNK